MNYEENSWLKDHSRQSFHQVLNNDFNKLIFSIAVIIILCTIALNVFIILTVIIDKSMRNYTNIQFASMSCADTLVGAIAMPSMLVSTLYQHWPLGDNLCILWCVGDFVGGNVSIICLALISYHRLQCIKKPFGNKKKSLKESLRPSLIIWPLVFLFWTIPIVIIIKNYPLTKNYMNFKECYYMYTIEYVIVVDLVAYVLPATLVIILQVLIYLSLKNKHKLVNPLLTNFNHSIGYNHNHHQTTGINNAKRNAASRSVNLNLSKKNSLILSNDLSSSYVEICAVQKRKASFDETCLPKLVEGATLNGPIKTSLSTDSIHSKVHFTIHNNQNLGNLLQTHLSQQSVKKIDKNNKMDYLALNHLSYSNLTKNRKAFRTLFFVTVSLVIFWTPWIVLWPVDTYCKCVPGYLYSISYWMEYLNSFVNSIILIAGNQHFRMKVIAIGVKLKKCMLIPVRCLIH